ncbi:MAG TPA: hypothetical protein VKF81_17915 [Blastocatellia bacterium]|nr:hypothetical protein [Blastocatellia bacterium]
MKTITRFGTIAASLIFAVSSVALGTPKTHRTNQYVTVAGTVLKIDKKDRTLLVADRASKKLYLIEVPEHAAFKITFGRYMRLAEPGLGDVIEKERVQIRCISRDKDNLARLEDGQPVIRVTAAE